VTSIREVLHRLLDRTKVPERVPRDYAYTVHWLKEARSWSDSKRERVRDALDQMMPASTFREESDESRYTLSQVDDVPHTGASLAALLRVLDALAKESSEEESDG
jgi:hypothetical protein